MFKLVKVLVVSVTLTMSWVSGSVAMDGFSFATPIGYDKDYSSFSLLETSSMGEGFQLSLKVFSTADGDLESENIVECVEEDSQDGDNPLPYRLPNCNIDFLRTELNRLYKDMLQSIDQFGGYHLVNFNQGGWNAFNPFPLRHNMQLENIAEKPGFCERYALIIDGVKVLEEQDPVDGTFCERPLMPEIHSLICPAKYLNTGEATFKNCIVIIEEHVWYSGGSHVSSFHIQPAPFMRLPYNFKQEVDKFHNLSKTLFKVHSVPEGDVLNIRAEPSANSKITGTLTNKEFIYITELDPSNKWGKVLPGNAPPDYSYYEDRWVSMRYLMKITGD